MSWYDFACQYVDMKWKAASAKYRRDIARAMVAATPPLIVGRPPYTDQEFRSAMNNWGFNTKRRPDAPADVAERCGGFQRTPGRFATWLNPGSPGRSSRPPPPGWTDNAPPRHRP